MPPIDVMTVNEPPSFTAGADQTVFEDAGPRTVAGWATGISPGPPSQSGQSVTFSASNDAAALFAAQPEVQPNGTLRFTPAADASGSATVTVRAVDDGGTANGGNDTSAPQTFAIAVTALNDAPEFTPGASQSVPEDAGAQTVPGWATGIATGPSDESGQSVVFVVGNDSPGLFAVQPQVAPDGTLTYTPAADASGTATVTVEAVDDGGDADGGSDTSAAQTFTIAVSEVNEAPSFTAGPNQLVLVDSGPQTVPAWATGDLAGVGSESGQGITFSVSSDNPGLFGAGPQVAPDGTLTYTPAPGASGVATVTVQAVDDGGTANGGSDTSAAQTFTIEVATVNGAPVFTSGPDQTVPRTPAHRSSRAGRPASRPGRPATPAKRSASPSATTTRACSPRSRRSRRTGP